MNTLVSTRHEAALLAREPSSGHSPRASIRALLRDTALLVSHLSNGGQVDNQENLRRQCLRLVAQFSTALDAQGIAADVRDDAVIAQCGLIDEAALRYLPAASKGDWESRPLQVDRFGTHDAGTRIYERLEFRMREPAPNVDLLECYAAVLGLGFRGRYAARSGASADAHDGEAKRQALIAALVAQIDQLRPATRPGFVTDRSNTRLIDRLRSLSPWAIAGTACVIAILVWFAWDRILDAELAQLVQKVKRP
ncbi:MULTISPECIES: DotU family type IV/VI secretion system protein [unclassified Burkholderia]|uniref:DotU family type IV/VI secretion system protein n=1 Tax=unclassified Burkholderia TaxID=2613784 RepID=UPI0015C587DE|nr:MULTISPECIES: DotU family type IV/VI secretion system protein [unclassified Burkholderia]MDN7486514.1 DotU family type IV/VI secretion system protein [Burkholderia sp. AU45274]